MHCKVLQLSGRSNPNPKKASLFARNRNICEVRLRKVGMCVRGLSQGTHFDDNWTEIDGTWMGRIAASEGEAGLKTPALSFPKIEDCCLHVST